MDCAICKEHSYGQFICSSCEWKERWNYGSPYSGPQEILFNYVKQNMGNVNKWRTNDQ